MSNTRGSGNRDLLSKLASVEHVSIDVSLWKLQQNLSDGFSVNTSTPPEEHTRDTKGDWDIKITEFAVRSLLSELSPSTRMRKFTVT